MLIKTQKYTGTDNIYLAKFGSYLTGGNIFSMAVGFLLSIAFARLLPKEVYGQYRYILSFFGILTIASLQGINEAIIQGTANGHEGILKSGFKIKFKWSLLGSLASLITAVYFWLQNNNPFAISFFIIAFFLPFFNCGEIYQYYLDGKKRFDKKIIYTSLVQALASLAIIIALFLTDNIIILILTYFLSYSLFRFVYFYITIKRDKPNQQDDPKMITYGKHLSLMGILTILGQYLDKVLLFAFLGPAQLAIYSFATIPVEYARIPLQSIKELALPKLTTKDGQEIKNTLAKKIAKATILIVAIIIIYIAICPIFFKIFYPQYLDSVFYSQLLSLTLLVFPASMMLLALQAKMKTESLYKINIINSVTRLVLFAILIPLYGIIGAIIAILLNQLSGFLVTRFFFKRMN